MILEDGAALSSPVLPAPCPECNLPEQECKCDESKSAGDDSPGFFSMDSIVELGDMVAEVAGDIAGGIGDAIGAIFE